MKAQVTMFFIMMQLVFISCKKESISKEEFVFVKAVDSDINLVITGTVQLDDNNFVIAGFDQRLEKPSRIFKLDLQGNIIWKKNLPVLNKIVWKIIPVPGIGFATLGIEDYVHYKLSLCLYDLEGEMISCNTLGNEDWKIPHDMMQLSDGNYFIAGTYLTKQDSNVGNLITMSQTLQNPTFQSFKFPSDHYFIFCHGVCQLPDSTIAISASASRSNYGENKYLFILKTDLKGAVIKNSLIYDTLLSETPNAIVPYNDGLLVLTSRMNGFNMGDGIAVNYFYDATESASLIAGRINLVSLSKEGQFISRREIKDYPNYGMLNSIRTTKDGGFILCGTANQLNSTYVMSPTKIFILKLDSKLDVQWSKIINTSYRAIGIDAFQAPDGGYLAFGSYKSQDKVYGVLTIKTDANGNY